MIGVTELLQNQELADKIGTLEANLAKSKQGLMVYSV